MTMDCEELITTLTRQTESIIERAKKLDSYTLEQLNNKARPDSWSTLETLEHLNLYGDYYNPEIKRCISKSSRESAKTYKPGLIGNWFVGLMEPKEKLNTMKSPADKNPAGSALDKKVIKRFLDQQRDFLGLLQASQNAHLGKNKTSISISKIFKIKLGDTLRFNVAHNLRHMDQAERAVN